MSVLKAARLSKKLPLNRQELWQLDAYWRAANYLTACQLYLLDNPLLERPLKKSDLKQTIVGHWGTCPGRIGYFIMFVSGSGEAVNQCAE